MKLTVFNYKTNLIFLSSFKRVIKEGFRKFRATAKCSIVSQIMTTKKRFIWSLRSDILSHFFDGRNYGSSVRKIKNNGLLRKKKKQRGDSKAKRNKNGWGWRRLKRIGNDDFEKFSQFFQNKRTVTQLLLKGALSKNRPYSFENSIFLVCYDLNPLLFFN